MRDQADAAGRLTRLKLTNISKRFGKTLANNDVNLSVGRGQTHAILGENGAGKSTLVKIIYGVQQPDSGEIEWEGQPVKVASPAYARSIGIGMVFQNFSLCESMTVRENIALGMDKSIGFKTLDKKIEEISEVYGLPIHPMNYVYNLSMGERQRIEIIRALIQNPRLLIMDEPTSVLTPQEVDKLLETLRQLAVNNVSILYISHKLEEVRVLCDKVTIMCGGKVVATTNPAEESRESLATKMIRDNLVIPKRIESQKVGKVRLKLNNISVPAKSSFKTQLNNISLELSGGQIFGIAGIAGNGQNELLDVISGEHVGTEKGAVLLDGHDVSLVGPKERRLKGLGYIPGEILGHCAVSSLNLWENILLSAADTCHLTSQGFRQDKKAEAFAHQIVSNFNVVNSDIRNNIRSLSGGNLQKFIFGREMQQAPGVLVVVQPTRGVDLSSAGHIHQKLMEYASLGAVVLVISQDLDELLFISHQIAVITNGSLGPFYPVDQITEEKIGLMMTGADTVGTPSYY